MPKLPTLFHLVGDPDLSDFSVPLMDMGLDSLSAVEFRNRVQAPWGSGRSPVPGCHRIWRSEAFVARTSI